MKPTNLVAMMIVFTTAACTTPPPMRVSTAELMPAAESEITVKKSKAETAELIKGLMADRGLRVKTVAPSKSKSADYYVFTGPRQVIATTYDMASVGSWIAARLETIGDVTQVRFLGKPNLGGTEVCSDADKQLADADYWCQDTKINRDSPYFSQMSGQEEAQLIRGVIAEIKTKTVQ